MNAIKNKLFELKDNPLARGATILFIGSFVVNFASYLFNLVIGRMLGPIAYGEFLSLVTIVYLLSIPFSPAQTVVIKYISQLKVTSQTDNMKQVLTLMTKYVVLLTLIVTAILLIISPLVQSSLKIDGLWLVVLMAITFATFIPPTVLNAAFTGLEQYVAAIGTASLGIILRMLLSVAFIMIGWNVGGVFAAMIIASVITYIVSWEIILKYIPQKNHHPTIFTKAKLLIKRLTTNFDSQGKELRNEIAKYTIPVAIATIGSSAITQVDVILVKTFFPAYEAGIYSSLAIIGKVIPFFTIPLLTALFPQLVAKVTKGENFLKPFYVIQTIIIVFSLGISAVYFIFPELIVNLFFGSKYLDATKYIGIFSLFQTAFTVMNSYVNFFLATGNNKYAVQSIFALIAQIIGIALFHESITQVIYVSTIVCSLFIAYFTLCTIKIAHVAKNKI